MSVFKSIKNNFLKICFLSLLLIPSVTKAAYDMPGDTTGNINIYQYGSFYAKGATGSDIDATAIPASLQYTLYSNDPKRFLLSDDELVALTRKVYNSDTNFDATKINANSVYMIATDHGTSYIYDPTPQNGTNGDAVVLGIATKPTGDPKNPQPTDSASFYTFKNPPAKESDAANNAYNLIDKKEGRAEGTLIAEKNEYYNIQQQDQQAKDDAVKAAQQLAAAEEAYKNAVNGGTQSEIQQAAAALEQARTGKDTADANAAFRAQQLAAANKARDAQSAAAHANDGKCDSIGKMFSLECVLYAGSRVANIIFKLVSFITYIVGTLFDYSLELSINSAQLINQIGVVGITWAFIRDILNMTFIFILLYVAIQILINGSGKYNAKNMLARVVIVAVLMNFSLFGAKLMVDASNVVTLKIYEAMKTTSATAGTTGQNASISERVMNAVGLTMLYNISDIFSTETAKSCSADSGAIITISVMGSIFLLIICLALGLAGVLFLIRMVNIIFLFIKSPIFVWSHVLPGNPNMKKLTDNWWKEMMHVMTFPIMYMFWMLIAIIIFEKLGSARGEVSGSGTTSMSMIDLICVGPGGNGTLGNSIALVAIFGIVIIFMMKAIEYGVKNATSGAEGSVGANLANAAAKKFSGYQTALTKGLRDKTVAAVGGASVGAAKYGLGFAKDTTNRVVMTGVGALKGGRDGGTRWAGAKEGFLDPTIKRKEILRDAARKQVVNGGVIGELTGLTSAAARYADKNSDPTNAAGETKKKADERRTEKRAKDEALRYQAIDKAFKVLTQKEWQKKNPAGSLDDYKEHIKETMQKRTDALFKTDLMSKIDGRDKEPVKRSHIDIMMAAAIKETKDKDGKVTGVTFNEAAMHDKVKDLMTYHGKGGDGAKDLSLVQGKKRFQALATMKAEAALKEIEKGTTKSKSGALTKDALKNQIESIESAIKKMNGLPKDKDIEAAIEAGTEVEGVEHEKLGRNLNEAIKKMASATDKDAAKKKAIAAKEEFVNHVNAQLPKKMEELSKKLKAQEEAAKK